MRLRLPFPCFGESSGLNHVFQVAVASNMDPELFMKINVTSTEICMVLCVLLTACETIPQQDWNARTDEAVSAEGRELATRAWQTSMPNDDSLQERLEVDAFSQRAGLPARPRLSSLVKAAGTKLRSSIQTGLASWYGRAFQGRRTASGERFDMHALTAAHRTLPLGSRVLVTNLATGKSVMVRINDRGPFVEGRMIDLSFAAAVAIDLPRTGTARVSLERLVA
ncbi:septal ring lytic transglycosylase RlpA family protein [Burkholderia ubonensis]|uniref:septal ring lytic transglycosylase RlpA family protein n=1 Tax=Burkholderia ubonensis TaxID=101571 RepID=UPI001E48E1F5|nr:septal ring lytic transglycosylase RlpA family protein [Burkholderia ubonensis]